MKKPSAKIEACRGAAASVLFATPKALREMRALPAWVARDSGRDVSLTPVAMKMHVSTARCAGGGGVRAVVRFAEVATREDAEALVGKSVGAP